MPGKTPPLPADRLLVQEDSQPLLPAVPTTPHRSFLVQPLGQIRDGQISATLFSFPPENPVIPERLSDPECSYNGERRNIRNIACPCGFDGAAVVFADPNTGYTLRDACPRCLTFFT